MIVKVNETNNLKNTLSINSQLNTFTEMKNISIAVHGGAGTISKSLLTNEIETQYKEGLELAVEKGFEIIHQGGSALDAAQTAVTVLEDNSLFNAGKGSVFSSNGKQEMDASIMDGN